MIPGLEQVTHHTEISHFTKKCKILPASVDSSFPALHTSFREEMSVQWKQAQPPVMVSELPSHRTTWSSTWSLFHDFASITLFQVGSINFFLWTRSLRNFFLNQKKISEQFACTPWLWVPAKACSEPLKWGSLPQTSHQHQLMAHEGAKALCWVLAGGGLIRAGLSHCLLSYSSLKKTQKVQRTWSSVIMNIHQLHAATYCSFKWIDAGQIPRKCTKTPLQQL